MLGETVCKPMDAPPITTVWVVRFTWTGSYVWNNDGDVAVMYVRDGKLVDRLVK